MRTEVVPHSMTALFIRLHAATTMCTKTAVAASGMPFMALLPWSVGPVYEDGKPLYENDKLQTFTVETVRYKSTPARYSEPKKRPVTERKPPNRKKH